MAVATAAAIIGGIAALAGAGTAYHSSRESKRQAKDTARDQAYAADMASKKQANEDEMAKLSAATAARNARTRAVAATGNRPEMFKNMTGGVGGAGGAIKSLTGQ